jgi:hypothetical protein
LCKLLLNARIGLQQEKQIPDYASVIRCANVGNIGLLRLEFQAVASAQEKTDSELTSKFLEIRPATLFARELRMAVCNGARHDEIVRGPAGMA